MKEASLLAWQYQTYTEKVWITYDGTPSSGGGGGGGCPILWVDNGTAYIEEGLLDIHNIDGNDVVYAHELITTPAVEKNRYHLRLVEHVKTISHIDRVQLWGRTEEGGMVQLPLVSARHSDDGNVLWQLLWSDDWRTDVYGADHNDGVSEYIDLSFWVPRWLNLVELTFIIEGNNRIVK